MALRSRWGQVIGHEDCPFLKRWTIETKSGWSLRFHHFYPNHVEDVAHTHPWWFSTICLKGGYTDWSCVKGHPEKMDTLICGRMRFRSRNHQHKTVTGPEGAWTLVVTGPRNNLWGFWQDGRFIPHFKYFGQRAACDDD